MQNMASTNRIGAGRQRKYVLMKCLLHNHHFEEHFNIFIKSTQHFFVPSFTTTRLFKRRDVRIVNKGGTIFPLLTTANRCPLLHRQVAQTAIPSVCDVSPVHRGCRFAYRQKIRLASLRLAVARWSKTAKAKSLDF